jgi:hypothetical protein
MSISQLKYTFRDDSHFFIGLDRWSTGVMVVNKDIKEAIKQVNRQLSETSRDADATGRVQTIMPEDQLIAYLESHRPSTVISWRIETF